MGTPTRAPSTRAVQAEQTRQQIVEIAQRLFIELGYEATPLQTIADELGLTKAAVYYHFHAKIDILRAAMEPGIRRISALLDEASAIRGRRARTEYIVTGFVDYLVTNRHFTVMAATDSATKRSRLETDTLRQRAVTLFFGEHPTGAERMAYNAIFSIPDSLPDLVDLGDEELRQVMQTTMLHILRVPSQPRQ
jgi:AcrR family transcriptional regulator